MTANEQTLTQGPSTSGETPREGGVTLTRTAGEGAGKRGDKVDWEVGDVIDGKYAELQADALNNRAVSL